jgi:hypothetical protein
VENVIETVGWHRLPGIVRGRDRAGAVPRQAGRRTDREGLGR